MVTSARRFNDAFMEAPMDRRTFLKSVLAGGCAAVYSPATWGERGAAAALPNIVLILIDDLGWGDLACFGSRYYETQNLDRLADEGMRFTQAYAACAVCSPTRTALLTGRYPARIGVTDWIRARFQRKQDPLEKEYEGGYSGLPSQRLICPKNPYGLPLGEITLAETLKSAGYTTWHVGKWHLGDPGAFPENQGFDVNIGGCDFGQPPSYFDPYTREDQGTFPNLPPRKEGEYLTDRLADEAAALIRGHETGPFFLYLSHHAVHNPLQAPEALVEKYKAKPPTEQKSPVYAAMIERMDASIATIRQALQEKGFADNTLIVFTSDNGGLAMNTVNGPFRAGKGTPYEGGLRVPAIVHWPGVVPAGTIDDTPIISMDLFTTLCAAAGAPLPGGTALDGEDLMPLLRRQGVVSRETLYWHYPHYRNKEQGPYSVIRKGNWKLIRWYDTTNLELYNLAEDPSETRDVAASEPDKTAALNQQLLAWLAECHARLPKPNPDYKKP